MADAADIAEALLAKVATLSVGSPALPIAYPEVGFDPEADSQDGKYLDIRDFPNRPRWEGVTAGKLDQGLLQITVVWPRGQGVIDAKAAADEVMAHFAKGTVMVHGSAKVKVSSEPWQAAPLSDALELRVPVSIPWTAS
jgi:hypothetical protein